MDRSTRCFVGWLVLRHRTWEKFQEVVDQAPHAKQYFSDGLMLYADVYYHGGTYRAVLDKSETYSVEGNNSELRHYLARLHRSTRCHSKCVEALECAIALFVHYWNAQQLKRRNQPNYPTHLVEFISLRL